jgi:hypothetical protein
MIVCEARLSVILADHEPEVALQVRYLFVHLVVGDLTGIFPLEKSIELLETYKFSKRAVRVP